MTISLRTFITSMSEKKEFAYLQDKLNRASNDATSENQGIDGDYRKSSANTSIPSI